MPPYDKRQTITQWNDYDAFQTANPHKFVQGHFYCRPFGDQDVRPYFAVQKTPQGRSTPRPRRLVGLPSRSEAACAAAQGTRLRHCTVTVAGPDGAGSHAIRVEKCSPPAPSPCRLLAGGSRPPTHSPPRKHCTEETKSPTPLLAKPRH